MTDEAYRDWKASGSRAARIPGQTTVDQMLEDGEKSDRSDKPPIRKTLTVAEAVQRMLKKKGNPT